MVPGHSYIINLDPAYSRGGTHWSAVYVAREHPSVYYWDPYGLPPPRVVPLWAWQHSRGVERSDARWQKFATDENCGPRSLAALYELSRAPPRQERKTFRALANC